MKFLTNLRKAINKVPEKELVTPTSNIWYVIVQLYLINFVLWGKILTGQGLDITKLF